MLDVNATRVERVVSGGLLRPALARYLPIAEHGLIGDLHTVALVGTDGTIDWYCPRFDSPSVFAAILDADHGGMFRIAPDCDGWSSKQLYLPDTNIAAEFDATVAFWRRWLPARATAGSGARHGELMDSVYLCNKYGLPIYHDGWIELTRNLEWLIDHWDQPDEGIWETRGGRRDYTYSRLMSWVAVERGIRVARQRGLPADLPRWMAVRDTIYNQIMERGWNPARRAFVQPYDTDVLDASLLLMPLCKFIAPTDPRWISTLDAITAELVSDSLVYRYNVDASPDGLAGEEATFSLCSFWWVEALAQAGRLDEARLAFEKMLTYANHVGLTPRRSDRWASSSATSPKPSRTWR